METKEQKAKESVQKYFLCDSEKYGCREKEYCQFCGGKNTANDCDEDCQANIYNEGFYAGWDAAMEYIQNLPEWKQIMNAVDETKKELGIFQNGNNQ